MPTSADILRRYPNHTFVETGTLRGDGVQAALDAGFESVVSIEIDRDLFEKTMPRFAKDKRVALYRGDSGSELPFIMKEIQHPATIWLDAHGVAGDGTKGESPLIRELKCITRHPIKSHTILIDDFQVFDRAFRHNVTEADVFEVLSTICPHYKYTRIDAPGRPQSILAAVPSPLWERIDIDPRGAVDYVHLLNIGAHLVQMNYGDGEWRCILGGFTDTNSQGSSYYPDLGKALEQTILESRFTHWGYCDGKREVDRIEKWLQDHGVNVPKRRGISLDDLDRYKVARSRVWVFKDLLAAANVHGLFGPFLAAASRRNPLMVGPKHLLSSKLPIDTCGRVVTPLPDAWLQIDDIEKRTAEAICRHKPSIVFVSMGMAANVLVWRLVKRFPELSFLDTGALFDPYVDVFSRSAYRKPEFLQRRERSLREAKEILNSV